MRVIGGKYKHKRFDVPRTFKARPTTDFAKESLFNILHNVYVDFSDEPSALDLFAGTGSISLELVSRCCGKVISVEKDYQHYQFIQKVAKDIGDRAWLPIKADVFKYLERCNDTFDIVFADPPYILENLADIPSIVLSKGIIKQGGIFILEHGKNYDFKDVKGFVEHRNYGSVNFSFFMNEENINE